MTRILILIFVVISSLIQAQSGFTTRFPHKGIPLTTELYSREAQDFTIKTTDGVTRNLYNTLDSGKTVFVDLFYTTCTSCQLHAPTIEEIYQNTGAGEENIEFWGISNNLFDTNNVIDAYKEQYGITNPCAGPIGGGGATAFSIVIDGQNFMGFPSYCVICPDRTMFFNPVYPPTVTGFDPYFEECAATIGIEDKNHPAKENGILSVYPNPANNDLTLEINANTSGEVTIDIYNLLGIKTSSYSFKITRAIHTLTIPVDQLPGGSYFIKMMKDLQFIDSHKVLISGN